MKDYKASVCDRNANQRPKNGDWSYSSLVGVLYYRHYFASILLSPANQAELTRHLDQVTLPRKGKLSKERQAAERTEEFVKARRAHSAVESAINALEVHGLDKCPDHGIDGFKRYCCTGIVTRNIRRMGDILWQQDVERARKTKEKSLKYQRAA